MKCRLLHPLPEEHPGKGVFPIGHVIDARNDPTGRWYRQVPILVQIGAAESADEECATAANRTQSQLLAAQRSYVRVRHGIHPDDFDAFDNGLMVGYNRDGSWVPGPNASTVEESDEDEDEPEDTSDE